MEFKESKRGKSSSHHSHSHHDAVAPGSSSGLEAHSLKNFTIPKIRKTAEKVYLSTCHTNRREYSSINHTISQCRLDLSCELQSAWQFGETKLVHNEYLEKKYSAKRTEMRERGRRGCELEEQYCFLALSNNAMSRMYQSGICTRESTMKALGNPLLGVYLFRHSDVALNYARCRKHHVDNLMIFKVLYGKVKKIQPMVDKTKTSLDPSPNFDCHMSRLVPIPKEPIEQQANGSAVYLYEYNTLSKPVDKPRQCLPYATITVRFLGQKAESGPTITSLRFLSTGFPKWQEKRDSLNNCTVAKRIGKGKDATIIYEHFPKPADSSTQDSCSCNPEMNPLAPDTSSPCGNVQTNSFFALGTTDGQPEHNLEENHNPSQAQATEVNPPLPPSVDAFQNMNGDMLISFNYLEKFLSTLSASVALANSIGTSTVTTSKLIKDPRLLRRGGSRDQANPETGSGENLPLENREEYPDSYVNALPSPPTDAALSSGAIPSEPMALSQDSLCPEGFSYEAALKRIFFQNCDYGTLHEITQGNAKKDQHISDCQVGLSYASKEVVPECENQEYGDKETHNSSQMNRILLPIKKQAKRKYISEINHNSVTQELQPADVKIVHERFRPPSPPESLQAQQESRNKFIQDTQDMKNLTPETENHSKQGKNKLPKKRNSHDSTHGERKSSLRDNYLPHEKHKTLNLSHQGSDSCKKPRKHGPAVLMQSSPLPQEQVGKSNPKHIPFKSGNSYLPINTEKSSKNCLEEWLKYERMYIDKYFSKAPKVALKIGNMHLIPIDTSQEKDLVQTKEKPNLINVSFDAKVPHFKVIRDRSGKYPVVHGENKGEPMSPAVLHKDGRPNFTLAEEVDRNQDCPVFCDPMIENDLNVYYKEQEFSNEEINNPERQRRQSSSVGKNRMENIYEDEKQVVYMNKNCPTVVSDERKIKNACRSEVLYSEKFSSTYNLAWKKKYVSIETALVENQKRVSPGNQRGILPSRESSNLPIPVLSTECGNNQRNFLEVAKAAQSPSFGAWGTNVFGEHEDDMDYRKPNEACEQPTINEDLKVLFPQDLNFNNEIEVESEQCEDSLLPQDTAIPENLSADEMNSVYQLLESRIDWENLFGSSRSSETSKSSPPQEDGSQYFLKESSCIYSRTQKNHRELVNPVVVPDLQIQITNIIQSEFTLSQEPLAMQEEVVMCATPEIAEAEMTDAWQELESMAGPSQFTCENTDSSGKDELALKVWPEASELMRDLVLSPPPDSSVHKAIKYPLALSPQPAASSPPTKDGSTCSLAKPRGAQSKTPKAKDVKSKNGKGKLPASLKDKVTPSRSIRYAEAYGVTRKTTQYQSFEQFSSLSEGRIKTFSQSERHIRNVLNVLYSEASLCKSKRLSRKLDRAVLHLKKAHRRVYRSLQLITKVGEKRRNGPLPKSYEFIHNSLWECCDLEGYDFLTEKRYYSRHYWQKRKDDKREEKRASGLEVVRSRPSAPHHQGYSSSSSSSSRDHQGDRRSLSIEGLSSEVSVSHVNIPRITSSDRPHRSESRGSASSKGSLKDPRRGAEHKEPDEQLKAFPPPNADGERNLDFIILSTIHTEERSERLSSDVSSREASSVVLSAPSPIEKNVKFFNGLGESNLSCFTSKPDLEDDGEITSRANPDIFISILKSQTEQFFNVDVSKTDDLKLPRDFPQLESHLPAVSSELRTGSEDVVGCSDSLAPCTNQERESVFLHFSGISVKNNETKWQTPHSETLSRSLPTVSSLATHSPSLQEQPLEQLKEQPPEQLKEQPPEQLKDQLLENLKDQPQKRLQWQPPEQLKEQPKDQPREQPQMQLQGQLQEQPPEQPKNQPQEQPQMQLQEQLEQPQMQLQEQLQEQPPEQLKDQPLEQPKDQLQEQSQMQLQEQLQEQPQKQPQMQLQEKLQEQLAQPQMQLQEQPPEQLKSQPQEQPQIQLQEQLEEQPPEQPKNQPQEQPQMQLQEKLQEQLAQPQIQLQEQLQEQPPEQLKDQPPEQTRDQPLEQTRDRPPEQTRDWPVEQPRDQPLEQPRDWPLEQPKDLLQEQSQMQLQEQLHKQPSEHLKEQLLQSLEQPKDQPQEQSQMQLQEQLEQPQEQLQKQSPEQLKNQPLEQPKDQPQKQLQECLQEQLLEQLQEQPQKQLQEQLQEQPLEQVQEQPKDQPLEQPKEQPQKQLQEQPQEQVQEQMQEQPPEQLKEQLQDQPLEQPKDQLQEQPQKQPQEQVQEQMQEQPPEQLKEQPLDQSKDQLQEQPQKQLQEQLQGQPQEQAQEQLKEQLQEQLQELPQPQEQSRELLQEQLQGQSQLQNGGEGALGIIGMPEPLVKKNCKEKTVEMVLMNTSLENTKSSSQKSLVKKNDRKRRLRPVEKEQWPERIVKKSNVLTGPLEKWPIQIVSLSKKVRAWDRSLAVAAPCSKKARHQEGRIEVGNEPALSSTALPATGMGDPVCRWKGASQMSIMKMHLGIPEATPAQQPEEGHSSKDPTTFVVKLSRILQKADKSSTLKSLQGQVKTCQTVRPLFIETFERKQKCSFKHVLISRELLVEGDGWNNCRHCLHPRAVDSLVELQMMIETMQFIENKKGLLGSEPTFRSFLWYDASLYEELLRGNKVYQQQFCLYPAFQDRLKYNAFSELQHYRGQLIKLLEEARKENKSYYAILKYKRQIEECEDIMKHCSNYFDFILSAPLTCGVNFGDNLEDLESLRKSTLEPISNQDHLTKIQSCPGKQDHLWIIMEMISYKMHFIKNSESVSMKISLYGLEHIFFDAAKSLVWKEKGPSVSKSNSPKIKELTFNQCVLKKFQQIYETLEADGQAEDVSKNCLEETLGNTLNICCVGEILDQAESADLKQLEELTVRCTSHLETLKKCFQILQEAPVDSLLITEDNVLDVFNKHSHQVVILKPEAVEMYIEMVMLAETIHFLKNVKAKKLNKPRFRGMLWFDLSLLPELIENQEKNASFSLLKENAATCLWEAVEVAILELKDEAAVICEYPKGANSSYALQLLSRELTELSEIRTLLEKSNPPIATYVDLMPYTMSVNYGTTLSELEHNYNQFSELLQNLTLASQKDLGKMAHVMKVMKTIQYLKVSCAKMGSCNVSLFTCQMFSNSERACQEIRVIHKMKPSVVARKLEICCRKSPSPLVLPHKDPAVSKKRSFTLALCESHQEQFESPDLPSHKKTKIDDLLITEVEKTKESKEPLHNISGNGSSVTQTYQGITSCEEQPLPTAVALTPIYHVPANLLRCPGPEDPQSSSCGQALVPVQGLGFCASHGPPFSTPPCAASQALLHVPYPCPPRPGLFPGVTCICASWQKGSFQNGH